MHVIIKTFDVEHQRKLRFIDFKNKQQNMG